MIKIILLLIVLVLVKSEFCNQYTSAESHFQSSQLSQVQPHPRDCGGLSCEKYMWGSYWTKIYTAQNTCFGWYGPLGALGPLSALGPPATYGNASVSGDFESDIKELNDGPLSNEGPLGDIPYFDTMVNQMNDFTKHMHGLGLWSVLGPIGPLGPLGPLGALGAFGVHGYAQNSDGDFVDGEQNVVRNVDMQWSESFGKQKWPLYENYTYIRSQQLSQQGNLDTSFYVMNLYGTNSWVLNANGNQFVTIMAVPIVTGGYVSVSIREVGTTQWISSGTIYYTNWIQIQIPTDTQIEVKASGSVYYNFYVVGSTEFMDRQPSIQYSGNYIKACPNSIQ